MEQEGLVGVCQGRKTRVSRECLQEYACNDRLECKVGKEMDCKYVFDEAESLFW